MHFHSTFSTICILHSLIFYFTSILICTVYIFALYFPLVAILNAPIQINRKNLYFQMAILLKILTQQVQHNDDRPISSKCVEQVTLETGRSKDVQLLQISILISLHDERLEMRNDRQFESTKKPFR